MSDQDFLSASSTLRQQAEELLRSNERDFQKYSLTDVQKLVQELNIYQAEIEIQNEELRQRQEQLQASRKQYMDLYNFAPVGYFTIAATGLIVGVNVTGATLLGCGPEELLQYTFTAFIVPEDQDTYYFYARNLRTSRQPQHCELRMHKTTGEIFHARLEGMAIVREDPQQPHYQTAVIDITERIQAEAALRGARDQLELRVQKRTMDLAAANESLQAEIAERKRTEMALRTSEERFRLVLDDSPIVVFNYDCDLRYTWLYNSMTHRSIEDILGKTDAELLAPEEAEPLTALLTDVRDSGIGRREEVKLTIDGQTRWYDLKVEPRRTATGAIIGLNCTATDMTSYHHARAGQQLLAEVSEQLSSVLDPTTRLHKLAQLIVSSLADLCAIQLVDDAAISAPVIAHRDPDKARYIAERIKTAKLDPAQRYPVAHVLQSGQTVYYRSVPEEMPYWQANDLRAFVDELQIVSYIGVPLIAHDRIIGVLSLCNDSSGQHFERDSVHLAEELASRAAMALDNARLYAAEKQARAAAEAALQLRDQIFHLVSHDLKSPLTAIYGYVHLMQRRLKKIEIPEPERFARGLTQIARAAQRMTMQIQELLDVAALQAGQSLALQREFFDVGELIQHLVDGKRQLSDTHTLRYEAPASSLLLFGDTMRIERVFDNLLGNAIKYSPDGDEIWLTLSQQQHQHTDWIVFEIRDQGIGIPAEDLPFIFEPFRRASNTTAQIRGTGLGLAGARQIIEQHNGTITVSSQVGVGSTFTVRLPLAKD